MAEPDLEPAERGPAVTTRPSICPASRSRLRLKSPPPHRRAHGFSSGPPAPPHRPSRRFPRHHHRPGSGTSGTSSGVAREQAGDAPRDEEWSALFTHLRPYANADGILPKEFDDLVRESFGQLIEAA